MTSDEWTQDDWADGVGRAVDAAVRTVRAAGPGAAWDRPAGGLDWTCRETVEHLADDLFAYAAQLGAGAVAPAEVPFVWRSDRPGGPANVVFVRPETGAEGLALVLASCGALLGAQVRTASPAVRAHHVFGASDPVGFAAMGLVETLVHTDDVARGLGLSWQAPRDLSARALARLFPDVAVDGDPWRALLWATGRTELPGRPRRGTWRWYGEPRP